MLQRSEGPASWRTMVSAVALAVSLAACGGSDNDSAPPPADPGARGSLSGVITNAQTGEPVADAQVRVGTLSVRTGSDGTFTLTNVGVTDRAVVTVSAPGYAEAFEVTPVVQNASRSVAAQLLPLGTTGTLAVASGGDVSIAGSTARVTLPANALVRPDGSPASGTATVQLTVINPALDSGIMPGDFTARTAEGSRPMESFGAIVVEIRDASGAELNLAPGKTATIRIPVGTRATTLPDTIPLFYFDEATGYWIQEGTATLSASRDYYEGTVTHFTVWNADQIMDSVTLTGCVQNEDGSAVANASIFTDGVDYSGTSSAVSGTDGKFTVAIKKGAVATLVGLANGKFTNTVSKGPYQGNTQLYEVNTENGQLQGCLIVSQRNPAVSVKLTWGAAPSDIDSHLLLPNGGHIYYREEGSLTDAPWANLDVDDTSSFGPEVVTIRKPMVGTYRYLAHNYSGSFAPGIMNSPTRIELNVDGVQQIFMPPTGEGSNRWWHVFDLVVDAQCRITVTPVNAWLSASPALASTSEPVYCTPPN